MQAYNTPAQDGSFTQSSALPPLAIGRTVGILLLLQLATALTLPFILSKPVTYGSPGFLTAVAEHSSQIRFAVILSFIGSALTILLGITLFKHFQKYSQSVAILFIVVCSLSCILDLVHAGTIISMISLSSQFVASDTQNAELYKVVGAAVASARRSAHIVQLLAIGVWMFVFYISLFRFKIIPRLLAMLGCIGITLQFIGVTSMMFLAHRPIGEMAMPLLPIQITVAIWLIVKGFNNPLKPARPPVE
jgi:hypothetical protein